MDLRIKNARISFAHGLWNKSAATETAEPKYSCDYIIVPGATVEMKLPDGTWKPTTLLEAEQAALLEAFKGDKKKAAAFFDKLEASKRAIRNGDKNTDRNGDVRDGYAGSWYIAPKSKTRMPVYNKDRSEVTSEADSPVYSGCYVNARLSLYVNLAPGKQGVFASMQGTQFAADGDAFGGGRKAGADEFDNIADGVDATDFS